MPFVGTLVNSAAILIFSLLGCLLGKALPERVNRMLLSAVAICVVYIGLNDALAAAPAVPEGFFLSAGVTKFLVIIISLCIGAVIGEIIDIDKWVGKAGEKLEAKFSKGEGSSGNFVRGFMNCTIITCVGAMSVNGAILDAVGKPDVLIAKAVLDGISVFILAVSFGIGCAFSFIPTLLYQGGITLIALLLSAFIPEAAISYMSATGGLIIVLIGTNFLGATNVKTANMIPAVFMPFILTPIINLF
jgi:uncharacterized membrane protein YqgA involved in biofilm formation